MKRIGEWSLIELVMKRVNQSSRIDQVVLATSTNPKDDIIEIKCKLKHKLKDMGIEHSTLEIEFEDESCAGCCE